MCYLPKREVNLRMSTHFLRKKQIGLFSTVNPRFYVLTKVPFVRANVIFNCLNFRQTFVNSFKEMIRIAEDCT